MSDMARKLQTKSAEELDVDARFLLANERTMLAWVRTGLTVIAGGIAVAFLYGDSTLVTITGTGAIIFGGLLSFVGYLRYKKADVAIRSGELPPTGHGIVFVVFGVVIFSVLLILAKSFGVK